LSAEATLIKRGVAAYVCACLQPPMPQGHLLWRWPWRCIPCELCTPIGRRRECTAGHIPVGHFSIETRTGRDGKLSSQERPRLAGANGHRTARISCPALASTLYGRNTCPKIVHNRP
jgi:hypothetical protein